MSITLAPDYYLQNFIFLIDWVNQRYADLLDPQERFFIRQLQQLDNHSQCLLVRLISRKGPWFRADKLQYAEIPAIEQAAKQLLALDLIDLNSELTLEELAGLLTKNELITLFESELQRCKTERKSVMLARLTDLYPHQKTWPSWTHNQFGNLYYLNWTPVINTFLLLFFGNPHQNLSEFVLQDLGLLNYESYQVDIHHRLFSQREDIEHYQLLVRLRDALENASNIDELLVIAAQIPPASTHPATERRRARLCNQLAAVLERHQFYDQALELYSQHTLPPARERRIRLLAKRGELELAWQYLNQLLAQPLNEQERQIGQRLAPRLAKKLGLSVSKKIPPFIAETRLTLQRQATDEYLRVEELARVYYHTPASPCYYVENFLFTSLLGLWLWPAMFSHVAGAFANPFQMAPLDLYHENFLQHRPDINELWTLLDQATHQDHLRSTWRTKHGIANALVHWQVVDEQLLELALECIPHTHLKIIFAQLLFDLANNRSGFPDLIQFFPAEKVYRLIEIKGPGDRIQDNQRRWLEFFSEHNIPAEVCYVSW